ncbi:MAG: hypothetical protein KGL10_01095 [Alphaproteobacteria bacterium]|nr:hypothetical protein [Alphaproteobacteria bacterium]MDE2335885.1 hypothetical protein [Alphaproteobacteria bacterium]
MGMFTNYIKVGRTASPEKFLKAFQKADYSSDIGNLIAGALEAFGAGHPGNIQTALARAPLERYPHLLLAPEILNRLPEKYGDKTKDINIALAEIPAEKKKEFLNAALHTALMRKIGDKAFYALLLEAGADAAAPVGGHASAMLVTAACSKQPIDVIRLLHDNGASFDDALMTMHCQNRAIADIERLEFFQKSITGKAPEPPAPAASPADALTERELLALILEQVMEITKRLPPTQPAPETAPQPQAKAPRKRYPSL